MLFLKSKGFRLRADDPSEGVRIAIDKILCYEPIDHDNGRFYIEYRLVDESHQLYFKSKAERDLELSRWDSILCPKEQIY